MPDNPGLDADLLPITEVERQTGIRQATLRMWEKRYGFPQPLRDRHGNRVYPSSQVARLHAVRRLIDQGARPGKIFSGAMAELVHDKAGERFAQPGAGCNEAFRRILAMLRAYRLGELHGLFQHRLLEMGLRRFVVEFLAPLSAEVGLAWCRGDLPVRCEHLYAQVAMSVLHARQAAVRASGDGRPKIVLATLTGEGHVLGIMMVEAVLVSLGMDCIQLGAEAPPHEVAAAAHETSAGIVALSFSSYFPRKSMARMVAALRCALPQETCLWVGGEGARGLSVPGPGVEVFDTLEAIDAALARRHLPDENAMPSPARHKEY